jgi:hypothetical protein
VHAYNHSAYEGLHSRLANTVLSRHFVSEARSRVARAQQALCMLKHNDMLDTGGLRSTN